MITTKRLFIIISLFFALTSITAEETWHLTAREAFEKIQEQGDAILFLDVRDPVEIKFIGFTDMVDLNIPFRLVKREAWIPESGSFAMPLNPDFINQVKRAVKEKGLDDTATIITMCRSGSARGKPSAKLLRENGFPNSYYVLHGFQGDPLPEGNLKQFRLLNGWQNSGLPWSLSANPDKIYKP